MADKFYKLKQGHIYEIIWIDNNVMDQTGWVAPEDLEEYAKNNANSFIRSTGYFYAQDRMFITLVGDHDIANINTTMRAIKILKPCIAKIRGYAPLNIGG